jgi:DNA ligase-1
MNIFEISTALFKRDTTGGIRQWYYQTGYDEAGRWAWRTVSGLYGGKMVESEWKFVESKNVGRANATTLEEQASSEAASEFVKKRDRGYFDRVEDIDTFDKFKPMLAKEMSDFDGKFPIYAQPKLDGIRCVARADGLWTRQGKPILSVPHIVEALTLFFAEHPTAILDGELYNHDLRDDFNSIASMVRKEKLQEEDIQKSRELVQYHIYDYFDTTKPKLTFAERELLRWFAQSDDVECVKIVPTVLVQNIETLDTLYGSYLEAGYEGQMVRKNTAYENKRTKNLIKRKEFLTDEFPVVEMREGLGNWSGMVKHFVLRNKDGSIFSAGVRGTQETMRALWESKKTPDWVTLRFFKPTPDGVPRFPVVITWGYGSRVD